jgi:tRNA modification GTPase
LRVFLKNSSDEVLPFDAILGDLEVLGKADVFAVPDMICVSGKTGQGVDALVSAISEILKDRSSSAGIATRERHRLALLDSTEFLAAATSGLALGPNSYEVVAEDIRSAIRSLDSLIGHVDVENVLDEIFSSFCLGK